MKEIEPNPKLNKILAGLICLMAVLPLYLGFHSMTFLPPEEWFWSAVPIAIGALILLAAAYVWRRPPMNAARVTFHDGGFRLEVKQVFRGEKAFDLAWSDINEITATNGGLYGGRWMRIYYGAGRDNALFSPVWTTLDTLGIVERLEVSARNSGFFLEKQTGFWKRMVRDRWIVRKAP